MPGIYALFSALSGVFAALAVTQKNTVLFLVCLFSVVFFVLMQKGIVLKAAYVIIFIIVFLNTFSGFYTLNLPQIPQELNGKTVTLTAKANDFSKETIRPNSFEISHIKIGGRQFSGTAKVYCGMKSPPPPYSEVKITGRFRVIGQNGIQNKINMISYVIYAKDFKIKKSNPLFKQLTALRKRIANNVLLSMKSSEAMLLLSSSAGVSSISYEEKEKFIQTGTAHIFAVSGLHMGILGKSTEKLLSGTGIRSGTFATVFLLFFVLLVGFRVSALRAFLMFAVSETARITGREQVPINTLAFVATVLILINPLIIFSVSFQMSFLAIFALIVFAPAIYENLPQRIIFKMLSEVISVQLILYPITGIYFHSLSVVSFLANLVIIPFMYIALPVGIFQIILSTLSLKTAKITAPVSNFVFYLLDKITLFFSRIPHSSLNVRTNAILLSVYIVSLAVFYISIKSKKSVIKVIGIALLLISFCAPFLTKPNFSVYPLNLKGEDGFIITKGSYTVYITSPTILKSEESDIFSINQALGRYGINNISLLICDAPLYYKESSGISLITGKFNPKVIVIPYPETDLSNTFFRLHRKQSKTYYANNNTKITLDGMQITFFKGKNKYAILIEENGKRYLLIGKNFAPETALPYVDVLIAPKGFDAEQVRFGKLYSY